LSGERGMTAGSPDRRSGQQVQGPYMYSDAVLTGPCLSVIRPWISSDWHYHCKSQIRAEMSNEINPPSRTKAAGREPTAAFGFDSVWAATADSVGDDLTILFLDNGYDVANCAPMSGRDASSHRI
jgi:hypothetical protein